MRKSQNEIVTQKQLELTQAMADYHAHYGERAEVKLVEIMGKKTLVLTLTNTVHKDAPIERPMGSCWDSARSRLSRTLADMRKK